MPGCCVHAFVCHVHLFDETNELWIIILTGCRDRKCFSNAREIVMDHNIQKPNHIIASPAKSMASVIAAPAKLARVEFNLF